ncbi:MAG: hypothetical protein AB7T22_17410 [Calditrichaceae bacterium]
MLPGTIFQNIYKISFSKMFAIKKISEWVYQYDSDLNDFEIVPDTEIVKPQTLFKYYSLNDYAVDGLYHSYLYATHPDQFNDLYDCFYDLVEADSSLDYIFELLDRIRDPAENRKKYADNSQEFINSFLLWLKASIYRYHGVVSMTTSVALI